MAKRGRPEGSIIGLLDDPGRFAVAIWFVCTEYLGLAPYHAADLTIFLITSHEPITTESIEGVLLKSSTGPPPMVTIKGHSDWIRRKGSEAIKRARENEREWAWLTMSSSLIVALLRHLAEGDAGGLHITCEMLRCAGWGETLDRVGKRAEASLRNTNFSPSEEWKPKRAAAKLLAKAREIKNGRT